MEEVVPGRNDGDSWGESFPRPWFISAMTGTMKSLIGIWRQHVDPVIADGGRPERGSSQLDPGAFKDNYGSAGRKTKKSIDTSRHS